MPTITCRYATFAVAGILFLSSTGCQSGGGSRWAWWNPMSRSASDTTLVARSAPELPSDIATPLVEGVKPVPTAVAAAPSAAAAQVPQIQGLPPITPTSQAIASTPAAEAAKIASRALPSPPTTTAIPAEPTAPSYPVAAIPPMSPKAPASASPSAGPYDPNAYEEKAVAVAAASPDPSSGDRYGTLGNRYASAPPQAVATSPASSTPAFSPVETPASPAATGDRYGSTNRYSTPDRYAAAVSVAQTPVAQTSPPVQSLPAPTSLAASTPPSVTEPVANLREQVSPYNTTAPVVGTLPVTEAPKMAAQAIATTTPNATAAPKVRLATAAGAYRPGGTGTYQSTLSIATRPSESSSPSAAPSSDTPQPSAYPTTGSQLR